MFASLLNSPCSLIPKFKNQDLKLKGKESVRIVSFEAPKHLYFIKRARIQKTRPQALISLGTSDYVFSLSIMLTMPMASWAVPRVF